jgi:hypothetical protein
MDNLRLNETRLARKARTCVSFHICSNLILERFLLLEVIEIFIFIIDRISA